jgi:hypothetical protein
MKTTYPYFGAWEGCGCCVETREAIYTVDRIDGERIVFNQGGRIEGRRD